VLIPNLSGATRQTLSVFVKWGVKFALGVMTSLNLKSIEFQASSKDYNKEKNDIFVSLVSFIEEKLCLPKINKKNTPVPQAV